MYRLKRINYLILSFLCLIFIGKVNALVSPTDRFYINDYANILSSDTEDYIFNKSVKLNEVDGTQIVVVTVKNLEGKSIEDYSLELARKFEIGSKEKNNGLLLLLALEEREFRVEVGTGLEGILPDGKTGRFQDEYIIPYLKANNFDEGIKNGYDAFYNEIVELNRLDLETTNPTKYNTYNSNQADLIMCTLLSGLAAGFLLSQLSKSNKFILILYGIIWFASYIITIFIEKQLYSQLLLMHLVTAVIMYVIMSLASSTRSSSRGGYYRSSGSSYRSSGSSHHGGGGGFSGGGSSRHF